MYINLLVGGKKNNNVKEPARNARKPALKPKPVRDNIYGNRDSMMPDSTSIPITNLESYVRDKKTEEDPYETEFKVCPLISYFRRPCTCIIYLNISVLKIILKLL